MKRWASPKPVASQLGMDVLQQKLTGAQLPGFKAFGVKFSRMEITSFQLPSMRISFIPNVGLTVSIDQVTIKVHGAWELDLSTKSDCSGDFDLTVFGMSLSVDLSLGSDESGSPTVLPFGCNTYIGGVDVHVSAFIDWLITVFDIDSEIAREIKNKICPAVYDAAVKYLYPVLQNLPAAARLNKVVGFDYSLTGPPAETSDNLYVNVKGEIFGLLRRFTPPFSPRPMYLPDDQNLMIYIALSDYLFNSAWFAYQSAGKLVFNVTNEMIPKLNTLYFSFLIPQLEKLYPHMPMKLKITSPSAPSVNLNPGNVRLAPVLEIQAYALLPNASLAPLFLLKLTTEVFAEVSLHSNRIVGSVKCNRVQIELEHSDVGPFSVTLMAFTLNTIISTTVLPKVNEILSKGYPLPSLQDVQLKNLVLKQYKHFLLLGADIQYG
ncbi:bactericidal permeability-increasing protein-like isoform X2 [Hyperolius riggenbachi]|uniref:bactericidal permeability-increasing protein-like isoform X2 n=1 Tax=Hyperolius riggenbachi TaxID=752182 RepID=UPI0035A27811